MAGRGITGFNFGEPRKPMQFKFSQSAPGQGSVLNSVGNQAGTGNTPRASQPMASQPMAAQPTASKSMDAQATPPANPQFSAQAAPQFNVQATPPKADDMQERGESRFAYLYKTRGLKEAQKLRTQETLQRQKEKRTDYMNHVRRMTDLFADDEELLEEAKDDPNQMEWAKDVLEKKKERRKETWRFRNQLMHSEWLLDKPEDFTENWIMIPVPQGKRNLVIASGGQTVTYAKNGMAVTTFSSHLPGGGKHKHHWNTESAILDCVFNENTKTFYILDMMCWRQTPMYDTETQFRFYWMHEKFLEVPEVATIGRNNQFRFEPLPNFRCETQNLNNVLSCEMSVPMDGILFYHKLAHYTFGFTPLVLWLRPFMIPEALGIMVPQKYIDRAPPDYKGFDKHREQCIANLTTREENEKKKIAEKRKKRTERLEEKEPKEVSLNRLHQSFVKSETESMET